MLGLEVRDLETCNVKSSILYSYFIGVFSVSKILYTDFRKMRVYTHHNYSIPYPAIWRNKSFIISEAAKKELQAVNDARNIVLYFGNVLMSSNMHLTNDRSPN